VIFGSSANYRVIRGIHYANAPQKTGEVVIGDNYRRRRSKGSAVRSNIQALIAAACKVVTRDIRNTTQQSQARIRAVTDQTVFNTVSRAVDGAVYWLTQFNRGHAVCNAGILNNEVKQMRVIMQRGCAAINGCTIGTTSKACQRQIFYCYVARRNLDTGLTGSNRVERRIGTVRTDTSNGHWLVNHSDTVFINTRRCQDLTLATGK